MPHFLSEVGIHFVVGLASTELTSSERELLAELQPAGIILFRHNVAQTSSWPEQLRALIDSAAATTQRKRFLVSIDHEGGSVNRLPGPVTHFPPAMHWGESTGAVSGAMARELRALGINLTFSPVLDVWSDRRNSVIGPRAFGADPRHVAQQALAFLNQAQHYGILTCGKHFPGHGATIADSHLELPRLDTSFAQLEVRELVPFRSAINAGLPLLMTAHVVYSAIDAQQPATFSRRIITDLLRTTLGFQGPVVSDALDMGALSGIPVELIPGRFLAAGGDLLLVAQPKNELPLAHAKRMAQALSETLAQGTIPDDAVSKRRIAGLFSHLDAIEKPVNFTVADIGCEEHQRLCADVKASTAA